MKKTEKSADTMTINQSGFGEEGTAIMQNTVAASAAGADEGTGLALTTAATGGAGAGARVAGGVASKAASKAVDGTKNIASKIGDKVIDILLNHSISPKVVHTAGKTAFRIRGGGMNTRRDAIKQIKIDLNTKQMRVEGAVKGAKELQKKVIQLCQNTDIC